MGGSVFVNQAQLKELNCGNQKGGPMLGKTKKPENETPVAVEKKEIPKPIAPTPQPTPKTVTAEEKTVIGPHISIEGQVNGLEHLVIEGSLIGNVAMQKHDFTVGANGRVDGEIHAQNVSISGHLNGTINALGRVEVTKEADFFGDIKAKSISVEDGAYFKGSIELNREPHRKTNFSAGEKAQSGLTAPKAPASLAADAKKEI
jgi:cytoskeletal protein CcmA (bactofilin family)